MLKAKVKYIVLIEDDEANFVLNSSAQYICMKISKTIDFVIRFKFGMKFVELERSSNLIKIF